MTLRPSFKFTRRQFLTSGAVCLAAVSGLPFLAHTLIKKVRYCAITPEADDLKDYTKYDLSWVASENPTTVSIPELGDDYFKGLRTLLTVVDQSGRHLRRIWVPGLLHTGSFFGDKIYLITRGDSSVFYALDLNKMEITAFAKPDEGFLFGGHVIPWTVPGQFAVTVNNQKEGAYDRVDIFDGAKLTKIASMNSFGFQAHELALSPDNKTLYVGHYGSYYTSGPYNRYEAQHKQYLRSVKENILFMPTMTYYPGSVAVIDLETKVLQSRLSDTRNGAQGHLSPSSAGQVFLSRIPPLLTSRLSTMEDPVFAEGTDHKMCPPQLYDASSFLSSGTTVVVDNKEKQYLLPCTHTSKMVYGSVDNPGEMIDIGLSVQSRFRRPCGLAFHPDGKRYIISCDNGFAVVNRGTHDFIKRASIPVRLALHSHMCVG